MGTCDTRAVPVRYPSDMECTRDTVLMGLGDTREIPVGYGVYRDTVFMGLGDTREIPVGYGVYP